MKGPAGAGPATGGLQAGSTLHYPLSTHSPLSTAQACCCCIGRERRWRGELALTERAARRLADMRMAREQPMRPGSSCNSSARNNDYEIAVPSKFPGCGSCALRVSCARPARALRVQTADCPIDLNLCTKSRGKRRPGLAVGKIVGSAHEGINEVGAGTHVRRRSPCRSTRRHSAQARIEID